MWAHSGRHPGKFRHPLALGPPEVDVARRLRPLELLHRFAAEFVLRVAAVISRLVAVRVGVRARSGLEQLVQEVVCEFRLVARALPVPGDAALFVPALAVLVLRAALLVEFVAGAVCACSLPSASFFALKGLLILPF